MRRQDIQLLVSARHGDVAARCEVGRRYLLGVDGFPRHVATGFEHLTHESVRELPQAARIIAEHVALEEILQHGHQRTLERAAATGSPIAHLKLGVIALVLERRLDAAREHFGAAALQGSEAAQHALDALGGAAAKLDAGTVTATLRALDADGVVAGATIAMLGAHRAREAGDLEALCDNVQSAYDLAAAAAPAELSELVVAAVRMAETLGRPLRGIAPQHVRDSLEMHANKGDRDAAYALGRGLCGLANPALGDAVFAGQQNMRKGAAYLLRAADAGCDPAWLHLYRLHSDHRLSVANPQLARYFLEKAAARDQPEAQRMLGALLLREAASLADSEQAIQWLHLAALQGDAHARELLLSLVLPVACEDDETADAAIEQVRADHPWLAARLDVARHFGLTKLEALCFDPVEGLRPWGLVVGKNPFISQIRLSAPRAIPAPSERAQEAARRAAALFEQARGDALSIEGDLRRRSLRQRRVFEKHMLDESTFFADATASELDALRLGPKWAFRARESLSLALGA